MGPPRLGWQDVPLARAADTLHLPLPGDPAALSMGNPARHLLRLSRSKRTRPGSARRWRHDALFPERANIGFADVHGVGTISGSRSGNGGRG